MNRRTPARAAIAAALSLFTMLSLAAPASAATAEAKLSLLSSWTQTSASSYHAWNEGRLDQSAWSEYGLDWSTDYCSSSPDNPLGFDFRLSCHRHDFGYRNYKRVGQFPAHKSRLDDAFHADLRRRCAIYSSPVRPACYSLAWVYYQAVRAFGDTIITAADLARAAELKAAGQAQTAGATG